MSRRGHAGGPLSAAVFGVLCVFAWTAIGVSSAAIKTTPSLAGTWSCCGAGGAGPQTWVITSAGTGSGSGGGHPWPIQASLSGTSATIITGPYVDLPAYTATFKGTLSATGDSMNGTWSDTYGQSGTFTATGGGHKSILVCPRAHPHTGNCIPVPSDAIRPVGAPEQGGPNTAADPAAPPGERARGAIDWALKSKGNRAWRGFCEGFVESAYGTSGRFLSAAALEASLKMRSGPAPSGALVFFRADWSNGDRGHVGISLGAGRMISALSKIEVTDIPTSAYWKHQYIGWSYPPPSWPGRAPSSP